MDTLHTISPIDGRYRKHTEELARFSSEFALMQYRVRVEIEYLLFLSKHPLVKLRKFSPRERAYLRSLPLKLTTRDARTIKDIEEIDRGKINPVRNFREDSNTSRKLPKAVTHVHPVRNKVSNGARSRRGIISNGIKRTNHDVKAVEYYIRSRLSKNSLKDAVPWIHFALTSEDINSIAYGLIIADSLDFVLLPTLICLRDIIGTLAKKYQSLPMLARTHGQPASPTTLGKEFNVFSTRLKKQLAQLQAFEICVKCNGATGNYNAHYAAYPTIDWLQFTHDFTERFNMSLRRYIRLRSNLITTQIEPHDSLAELFDCIRRTNTICIDFAQDIWRYISDGWLIQISKLGETGSSTMPHKVNPIDFENAEGNLGLANALLTFFSTKLPISRLQRDLSDSTVERNFGVAFAHCLVGYLSLIRGLGKVAAHEVRITTILKKHPEVVSEGLQTILRREGIPDAYEKLKHFTRGKKITRKKLIEFINSMPVSQGTKEELMRITPENYTGLAHILVSLED